MRMVKCLNPKGLPKGFDIEKHGVDPIVKVEESRRRISVEYTFPGFHIVEDTREVSGKKLDFSRVHIESVGSLAQSGKPLLPSFSRYVQIPCNYNYKVKVRRGKQTQFDNILVAPAQEKLTDTAKAAIVFEYDREFYARDELYPKEIVEVSGPFKIEGYCALLLNVRPLRFNPAKRKLVGCGNITVHIDVTPKKIDEKQKPVPVQNVDLPRSTNFFLNPGPGIEARLMIPVAVSVAIVPVWKFYAFDLLIIYDYNLKSAVDKLVQWKTKIGLTIDTVPISSIGNTVQEIKDYIRDKRGRQYSSLRYVLLFGDIAAITPETIAWNRAARGEPNLWPDYYLTDYYYSTEIDSTGGDSDFTPPWLAIGRIPVGTLDEATRVVNDIIDYECNPPTDPNYYKNITLGAYFQDNLTCPWCSSEFDPRTFGNITRCPNCHHTPLNPQDGQENRAFLQTIEILYRYFVNSLNLQVERVYVSNNGGNENRFYNGNNIPADVRATFVTDNTATNSLVNAVTAGRLFIGHRDHGSEDGWDNPPLTRANMQNISTNMPSIIYSINCLTGSYGFTSDCFAETALKMNGEAPSLIAASDLSHTFLNDELIQGLFDATFGGLLPTYPSMGTGYPVKNSRLGDILNYAKTYLPVARPGSLIKKECEIYHVIGDPTLEVWTEQPKIVYLNVSLRRDILVIDLSECPRDSFVTIWYVRGRLKKPKLLKKIAPSSSHFTVSLRELIPTTTVTGPLQRPRLLACFKAPGYRFDQKIILL